MEKLLLDIIFYFLLTLDPVKPMNCSNFVILGGSRDMTRLKVPTPSCTPPSKCGLNLSSFSDQFLFSRISQHVLQYDIYTLIQFRHLFDKTQFLQSLSKVGWNLKVMIVHSNVPECDQVTINNAFLQTRMSRIRTAL